MNYEIAILGGDLRIVKLAKMLAKEKKIIVYGLEQAEEIKNIANIFYAKSLEQAIQEAQTIIAPIPFSKDGKNINANFTQTVISIQDIINNSKGKTIIVGAVSKEISKLFLENNIKIIDIMEDEELIILNAIATAEGAIEVAMNKTQKTIHGSKVLILGFGNVAKATAHKFAGLLADVTCAARKTRDFAWAEAYGYKYIQINNELSENLSEYDIIVNTVPACILTKNNLKYVRNDALIIDLASKPGGVDREAIKQYGLNFEWALGLPGKVAPTSAAEYIAKVLHKNI